MCPAQANAQRVLAGQAKTSPLLVITLATASLNSGSARPARNQSTHLGKSARLVGMVRTRLAIALQPLDSAETRGLCWSIQTQPCCVFPSYTRR
jgi:hypothetical protein